MPVVIGREDKLKKKVTCRSCASILEYWPNEPSWDGNTDEGIKILLITCPECGLRVRTSP